VAQCASPAGRDRWGGKRTGRLTRRAKNASGVGGADPEVVDRLGIGPQVALTGSVHPDRLARRIGGDQGGELRLAFGRVHVDRPARLGRTGRPRAPHAILMENGDPTRNDRERGHGTVGG
jgi:hypothetical protein